MADAINMLSIPIFCNGMECWIALWRMGIYTK